MPSRTKRLVRFRPRSSIGLSNWLLDTLDGSKAGLAIYDRRFRYVGVNVAVAVMNGVPPEEHLGLKPPDVLGLASRIIEPRIERVFLTGRPVYHHEFSASLPTRTDIGYWIQDYFPIGDERDRVAHVGILVVEITEQRRLEAIIGYLRTSMARPSPGDEKKLLALVRAPQPQGASLWRDKSSGVRFEVSSSTELPADILSGRELDVLSLLAQGKYNKEVASALKISEKTVETYRSRIKLKLGLKSLVELVHYAIRSGVVKL